MTTTKTISPAVRSEGLRRERILSSPRFSDGQFRNTAPVVPGIKGNPLPVLGEFFFTRGERIPRGPFPLVDPRTTWSQPAETGLRATWLGHSTLLLELDGARVLTDPVFGERASPVSFAGPKRFHRTPVAIEALPPVDAVLVSHDHYDHLCAPTIRALAGRDVPFVTSLGVGRRLEALGVRPERIVELDWWEAYDLPGRELRLTATPAQHFSGRSVGDRNTTLWSSWVLATGRRRVFFSGDTGLTEELKQVRTALGPFDLVMLEIGAWHPSWGDIHLGPANALVAHEWLGGGTLLPIHWGTFNLALHAWNEPAETLWARAEQTGVRLLTPPLGAALEPDRVERAVPWWRSLEAGAAPLPSAPAPTPRLR